MVTWYALSQPEPPAGVVRRPDGARRHRQPGRHRRRCTARARARADRGHARARAAGARHLPRRAARRPGARGEAARMPAGEIGWVRIEFDEAAESDALLAGAPRELDVNEWHNYACTPPAGAAVLARNDACVQAFRVGATTWAPAVPRRGGRRRCSRSGRRPAPTSSQARPRARGHPRHRRAAGRAAATRGAHRRSLRARRARCSRSRLAAHLRSSARGDRAHDLSARLL